MGAFRNWIIPAFLLSLRQAAWHKRLNQVKEAESPVEE